LPKENSNGLPSNNTFEHQEKEKERFQGLPEDEGSMEDLYASDDCIGKSLYFISVDQAYE
jgi:hypothetical protein